MVIDSVFFPKTKTLFYCKKSKLGKSKIFKLNTVTKESEEFCSCYLTPWLGPSMKQNRLKTDLFLQVSFNKIKIFFEAESCSKSSNLENMSISIPKGNIESFHQFGPDKLMITSREGHVFIIQYNIFTKNFAILGQKWIRALISSASICHKGEYVAISTCNNFGKLDKLYVWRLNKNYEFVLPKIMDFKVQKYSKEDHSGINDIRLGYIGDNLVIIGLQLLGDSTLFTFVAEETKLTELTLKENFIDGPFHGFGTFKETMWVVNPSGSVKELVFDV